MRAIATLLSIPGHKGRMKLNSRTRLLGFLPLTKYNIASVRHYSLNKIPLAAFNFILSLWITKRKWMMIFKPCLQELDADPVGQYLQRTRFDSVHDAGTVHFHTKWPTHRRVLQGCRVRRFQCKVSERKAHIKKPNENDLGPLQTCLSDRVWRLWKYETPSGANFSENIDHPLPALR